MDQFDRGFEHEVIFGILGRCHIYQQPAPGIDGDGGHLADEIAVRLALNSGSWFATMGATFHTTYVQDLPLGSTLIGPFSGDGATLDSLRLAVQISRRSCGTHMSEILSIWA